MHLVRADSRPDIVIKGHDVGPFGAEPEGMATNTSLEVSEAMENARIAQVLLHDADHVEVEDVDLHLLIHPSPPIGRRCRPHRKDIRATAARGGRRPHLSEGCGGIVTRPPMTLPP